MPLPSCTSAQLGGEKTGPEQRGGRRDPREGAVDEDEEGRDHTLETEIGICQWQNMISFWIDYESSGHPLGEVHRNHIPTPWKLCPARFGLASWIERLCCALGHLCSQ